MLLHRTDASIRCVDASTQRKNGRMHRSEFIDIINYITPRFNSLRHKLVGQARLDTGPRRIKWQDGTLNSYTPAARPMVAMPLNRGDFLLEIKTPQQISFVGVKLLSFPNCEEQSVGIPSTGFNGESQISFAILIAKVRNAAVFIRKIPRGTESHDR